MEGYRNFVKPSMVGLPRDLGRAIFKQIMNTPAPDYAKLNAEAKRLEAEMLKIRSRENAERNNSN